MLDCLDVASRLLYRTKPGHRGADRKNEQTQYNHPIHHKESPLEIMFFILNVAESSYESVLV